MTMNSTCYKQHDTRWASLPYPRSPWLIRNCGCGEVSICNAIIEMASLVNQTPKTIQPYMKQFAESRGNGTYHSGIPTAMKHYGLTEVSEHATMTKLWEQLRKGNRVAILLMGSRLAGSKKVKWTGCGHFVAVTAYKEANGQHWVYVKDSASTSSYRNGWITYEGNIKGACLKCWSGKLNGSMSTATAPIIVVTPDGKLTIDGIGGISTVKAMQRFFGTPQDGVITGQNQSLAKWYPALKSVKYGKGGSVCVRNMQRWLGIAQDGIWGKGTSTALQKKLGVTADGIFDKGSMSAWQKYLNTHDKAVYPTPTAKTLIDKEIDACKTQATWMKNYTYTWGKWKPRNVAMSAKYGTCVTYVACVLQRIGVLKSGEFIWHNNKGKVYGHNSKMTVTYPSGTLKGNKSKLKRGDIVMVGDKTDVGAGGNSHIFILNGTWDSSGNPYIWDNQSATRVKKGKNGLHTYGGGKKIIAVVRLK